MNNRTHLRDLSLGEGRPPVGARCQSKVLHDLGKSFLLEGSALVVVGRREDRACVVVVQIGRECVAHLHLQAFHLLFENKDKKR